MTSFTLKILAFLLFQLTFQRIGAQPSAAIVEVRLSNWRSNSEFTPFWSTSLNNGIVKLGRVFENVTLSVDQRVNWGENKSFQLGARFVESYPHGSHFFHQLFASIGFRAFEISAGWREHTAGLVDSTLSSGSMIFSRNAATIPRISLETPTFTDVPGTFGLIAFKAHWSHGWMGSKRFVKNPFLHEKSLHVRVFGPADFPVLGFVGMTHAVIWGGTHPEFGRIPASLSDYFDVVLNQAGKNDNLETEPTGTLGNSVAAVDMAIQVNLKTTRTLIYRQFYMEAQSDIRFRNKMDGIWGISVKHKDPNRLLSHILWEFIYTKQQGDRDPNEPRNDYSAYYANFVYQTGWTHRGRTLGNPLLFSDGSLIYPVKNTILVAHHIGFAGLLPGDLHYRVLATYSRNYGARDDCTDFGCTGNPQYYTGRLDQYSFLFEASGPLPIHDNLGFSAAVAVDSGELYPNSIGGMLGIRWSSHGDAAGAPWWE